MQKDYPELEGKEIIYNGEKAVVIGCNYDIGIAIVAKDDPDNYCSCYIGPMAPNRKRKDEKGLATWKTMFYSRVHEIKKGVVDTKLAIKVMGACEPGKHVGDFPAAENCPFGQ